jgi:transcriptional regulator with XRE-family HTH domain
MQRQARLSHSRAKRKGCDNPLAIAADKAGYTVRSLAERLGCSAPLLSQARTGKSSIKMSLAQKIEALTGYAATKANWPDLKLDK